MQIVKTNTLSADQILEIRNLSTEKENMTKHAFLSNELNFDLAFPCFYLGYENSKLVAFLTAFVPTTDEAEILAFTRPEHRGKGFFKALFGYVSEEMQKAGIKSMLLQLEPESKSGAEVLKKFKDVKWERSEYRMHYSGYEKPDCRYSLTISIAGNDNKTVFSSITKETFPDLEEKSNFIDAALNSEDRKAYILFNGSTPVGVFSIKCDNEGTFIYGLGIAEQYRGKGFGKQLISYALEESLKHPGKIMLDVDSNNPVAFEMYKKLGFFVDYQIDYYRCPLTAYKNN